MRFSRTDLSTAINEPTLESTNDKSSPFRPNVSFRAANVEKYLRKEKKKAPTKYREYIKSEWWARRKAKYYKRHPKKCAVCHTSKQIRLHNLRYGNYGREKDEHLVPLCERHHLTFHEQIGVKANMVEETNTFIDEQSQLEEFPRF
jgi:hypothetical protein